MNLEEAIKQNKVIINEILMLLDKDIQAIQLGIEALEIIQEVRASKNLDKLVSTVLGKIFKPLPSETE